MLYTCTVLQCSYGTKCRYNNNKHGPSPRNATHITGFGGSTNTGCFGWSFDPFLRMPFTCFPELFNTPLLSAIPNGHWFVSAASERSTHDCTCTACFLRG